MNTKLIYAKKGSALTQYVAFIPGKQAAGSGSAVDQVGAKNLAIGAGTSDGAVWANAGFMTTTDAVGGTSKGLVGTALPSANFKADSVVLAMTMRGIASAASASSKWFSTGPATGGGLQLRMGGTVTNGKFRLAVYANGSLGALSADSAITLFDDTVKNLMITTDSTAWVARVYINGVYDSGIGDLSLSGLNAAAGTAGAITVGTSQDPASDGTRPIRCADIHYLVWPGVALPSNIAALVARHNARPWQQLRQS